LECGTYTLRQPASRKAAIAAAGKRIKGVETPAWRQLEYRPEAAVPAFVSGPIKVSIGARCQRRIRKNAVGIIQRTQRRKRPAEAYFEQRTEIVGSAFVSRAIQVSVSARNEPAKRLGSIVH